MSLHAVVLVIHIAAGIGGLVLGPLAMRAPKRRGRHTDYGRRYHFAVAVLCATGAALALMNWSEIWWFLPIAVFSYANALLGYLAVKIRWEGWLQEHIAGMGGSYIALLTAVLVVNVGRDPLIVWFLPTIVGTPIIVIAISRAARGPLGRAVGRGPRKPAINPG